MFDLLKCLYFGINVFIYIIKPQKNKQHKQTNKKTTQENQPNFPPPQTKNLLLLEIQIFWHNKIALRNIIVQKLVRLWNTRLRKTI